MATVAEISSLFEGRKYDVCKWNKSGAWTGSWMRRTEPAVGPHIWEEVPHRQVLRATNAVDRTESSGRQEEAQVADQDQLRVLGIKEGAFGIEVVDASHEAVALAPAAALGLALVTVMTGVVARQVDRPGEDLTNNNVEQRPQGHVFRVLVETLHSRAYVLRKI